MDRRDWVGIGDSSSWMGGWTPGAGWVDGWMDTTRHHHPEMGRSAIIETTARAKELWNGDKHQQKHKDAICYCTQSQQQNINDTTRCQILCSMRLQCISKILTPCRMLKMSLVIAQINRRNLAWNTLYPPLPHIFWTAWTWGFIRRHLKYTIPIQKLSKSRLSDTFFVNFWSILRAGAKFT